MIKHSLKQGANQHLRAFCMATRWRPSIFEKRDTPSISPLCKTLIQKQWSRGETFIAVGAHKKDKERSRNYCSLSTFQEDKDKERSIETYHIPHKIS